MGSLQDIRDALRSDDKERARDLLQPLRQSRNAEIFYLSALAAPTASGVLNYLDTALNVEPRHVKAQELLSEVQAAREAAQARGDSAEVAVMRAVQAQIREDLGTLPRTDAQATSNVYEMLWDCQYCGTKKNLGLTHRFCPNCGAPQNPDSRYFPSDDEKVAVHNHRYVGVDVTCPACSELNSGASEFCSQCGAPLTEAAEARRLQEEWRKEGQRFVSSGSRDVVKEKFDAEMERIGVKQPEKPKRKSRRHECQNTGDYRCCELQFWLLSLVFSQLPKNPTSLSPDMSGNAR